MTLLRKHGRWLIITTLVGIAGAWIFASRPAPYISIAQVDVEPNVGLGTPVVPNMATEEQVATSGVVLARTAHALGVKPGDLAEVLSTSVSGTANVLSISCTMAPPTAAQRCAAAAVAAYIGFRNPSTSGHNPLHVTLVTPATLPTKPTGAGKRILLPLGAILGLALGIGEIFVRDRFDDRVRDRADLERCLDAPVLAEIPRVRRRAADPAFVFHRAPQSRAAEAYRYLRSYLKPLIDPVSDGGAVVMVTSAQSLDGRTCVVANLATALAHAGAAVIMVDADLRHPSLSELFSAGERPGLTELLAGAASLDEVASPTGIPGLQLVAAGDVADGAVELFEVTRLTRALGAMRAEADVVVIDSAPVLAVSDPITLARVSDLAVIVADVRRTRRGAASAAAQEIRAIGQRNIIGVLNGVPSFEHGRAEASLTRGLDVLAPSHGTSALPTGMTPPPGTNGQRRAYSAMSPRAHEPHDAETAADDPAQSGPDHE
jgi:polysaccharide biosynthesis transport protein